MKDFGVGHFFAAKVGLNTSHEVSVPSLDESPGVTVRVAASDRFEELLRQAADAWARGMADGCQGHHAKVGEQLICGDSEGVQSKWMAGQKH